jgi:negative regulator of sigma E activity
MLRLTTVLSIAIVAGIAAVFLLPPPWLEPIAAVAAVCALVLAIIVRVNTKTEPPDNAVAGVLLSIINLPEQPLAKVTEGRALTAFLASAAFLVSLALSVMVRANV